MRIEQFKVQMFSQIQKNNFKTTFAIFSPLIRIRTPQIMLVRLKYNLGSCRLTCDTHWTLLQLKDLVVQTLRVVGSTVQLSADLEGLRVFSDDSSSLSVLDIKHGAEIFLKGRYEKVVIDKSYVDLNGSIVSAGTTIKRIDVGEQNTFDVKADAHSPSGGFSSELKTAADSISTSPTKRSHSNSNHTTATNEVVGPPSSSIPSRVIRGLNVPTATTNTDMVEDSFQSQRSNSNPFDFNYDDESELIPHERDEGVRAPDAAERLTLLDHNQHRYGGDQGDPLSTQDRLKLAKYAQTLRETGLGEFDVHQQTNNRADEMMARRMQQELNLSGERYGGSGLGLGSRASLENANRARSQFPNSYRSDGASGERMSSKRTTSTTTDSSMPTSSASTTTQKSSNTTTSISSSRMGSAGLRALNSGGNGGSSVVASTSTASTRTQHTAAPPPPAASSTGFTGSRASRPSVSSSSTATSTRPSSMEALGGGSMSRRSVESGAKNQEGRMKSVADGSTSDRVSSRTSTNRAVVDVSTTPPRPPSAGSRHTSKVHGAVGGTTSSRKSVITSSLTSFRSASTRPSSGITDLSMEDDEDSLLQAAMALSLRDVQSSTAADKKEVIARKTDPLTGHRVSAGSGDKETSASRITARSTINSTSSSSNSGSSRVVGPLPGSTAHKQSLVGSDGVGRSKGPTAVAAVKVSPRPRGDSKTVSSTVSGDAARRTAQMRADSRAAADLQAKEETDLRRYHDDQRQQMQARNRDAADMRAFMQTGASSSRYGAASSSLDVDAEDALLQLAVSESLRAEGKERETTRPVHGDRRSVSSHPVYGGEEEDEDEQYARALHESLNDA